MRKIRQLLIAGTIATGGLVGFIGIGATAANADTFASCGPNTAAVVNLTLAKQLGYSPAYLCALAENPASAPNPLPPPVIVPPAPWTYNLPNASFPDGSFSNGNCNVDYNAVTNGATTAPDFNEAAALCALTLP